MGVRVRVGFKDSVQVQNAQNFSLGGTNVVLVRIYGDLYVLCLWCVSHQSFHKSYGITAAIPSATPVVICHNLR